MLLEAPATSMLSATPSTLYKRIQDNCFNTKSTFDFVTDETFSSSLLNHLLQTLSTLNRGVIRKNAFDSLITRLCKLQRVDDALHIIEYMARTDAGGCRPSATTFYPVLNILTRQKAIDHARRVVWRESGSDGTQLLPRCTWLRTFDALVLGTCKVKKVDGAMMLVRMMVDDGVPILYSTHIFIIKGLLQMLQSAFWDLRCRFDD
ncbi:pentatricopeptide repeat-containing protein At3g56030, mitochondrial-like [Arachis duranensis]|uniref:Pentatricopeptide repeat-containing protein At3g56030, mitochondrial-like n=1 Tax=Arachis duranensis TaxID=130453 RepID=A0A6P4C8I6_ARADU|nr:pentatricopeptide repeat-containing protein At3g56030, mitochondrial-like [Arachis duranensis]